jgi:hypothetical protein
MKKQRPVRTIRLAVLGVVAAAALTFATAAFGAFSPMLVVSRHVDVPSGVTTTDITLSQTDAEDPVFSVGILAPLGYTATLNQAPGTQIGTVEGTGVLFGTATTAVTGTLTVGSTTDPKLRTAGQICTGTATHNAIWLMNISAQGIPATPIPAFVDRVTMAPFAAFSSLSVRICLPHPTQPPNMKLLSVTVHVSGVLAPPAAPGAYRWTAIHVPYFAAAPIVNPGASIQTQSIDRTPVDASFAVKRITKTRRVKTKRGTTIFYSYFARLSGQARIAGQGAAGATVDILAGANKAASVTTNGSGLFTKTLRLKKTTTFQAQISQASSLVSGATCVPPIQVAPGATLPCRKVTQGGFTATSASITLKKPKLTVKHIKKKKSKKH